MSNKIKNKINLAKQIDNEIVEQEIVCYENAKKEKFRQNMLKIKVKELSEMENYDEIIKHNIELGKKYTQEILQNN